MPFTDLRYALRLARRAPFLTVAILVILAGGISVTTAVFGLVNAAWLRPLPYPDPDQLVTVSEVHPRRGEVSLVTASRYAAWKECGAWAESTGAVSEGAFTLGLPGDHAERVRGARVEPALLRMLGATPIAGRLLVAGDAEPDAGRAVLVSERFWRQRLYASPAAIGRTIRLDGRDAVVVGVLPYGFKLFNSALDVFTPLPFAIPPNDSRSLQVVARLAAGQSRGRAEAQLTAATSAVTRSATPDDEAWTPRVRPLDEVLWGEARPAYLLLLTAAGLLLALVAANVCNLLLARSDARREEFSLRLVLGAGRSGIVRQLVAEGLLLAFVSCALASLMCLWLQRLLTATVPEMTELRFDARVFGFAAFVSLLAGLAFGFVPAWSVLGHEAAGDLRAGAGAGRQRAGRVLAAAQLAAATALLIACGLLVRAAIAVRTIDAGFSTDRLLTASVALPETLYPAGDRRVAFYREAARAVSALPGAVSVALCTRLPLDGGIRSTRLEVEGRPQAGGDALPAASKAVSDSYFETVGLQVVAGEGLRGHGAGAVVISRLLARALWKGESRAVGARLRIDGGPWRRVTGVVADARQLLTEPPAAELYLPLEAAAAGEVFALVRTAGDPIALAPGLSSAMRRLDPDVPVSDLWTMASIVDSYAPAPFAAAFTLLAGIALLLSVLGLYAVIAFQMTRRAREFGIRLALGAGPARILRLVVWEGLRLSGVGALAGCAASLALGAILSHRFAGVPVGDPVVSVVVVGLLGLVSTLACLLPGRAAARVEPSVSLRRE
jgi:putative ABC transport system permease protein